MTAPKEKQEAVCGVLLGIIQFPDGEERVAINLVAADNVPVTMSLSNRQALTLFDGLGTMLESLGLLDEGGDGGAQCQMH